MCEVVEYTYAKMSQDVKTSIFQDGVSLIHERPRVFQVSWICSKTDRRPRSTSSRSLLVSSRRTTWPRAARSNCPPASAIRRSVRRQSIRPSQSSKVHVCCHSLFTSRLYWKWSMFYDIFTMRLTYKTKLPATSFSLVSRYVCQQRWP